MSAADARADAASANLATTPDYRDDPWQPAQELASKRAADLLRRAPPGFDPLAVLGEVDLIAWSGSITALAARLGLSATQLERGLKRLSRRGDRLVVEVNPVNSGPVLAALVRRMEEPRDR